MTKNSINLALLQLGTLPMSSSKLDYYFRICKSKNVSLVLLGEYVLNSFFKELENMPSSMIKEQSSHKIQVLKELCAQYELAVVAPIVRIKGKKLYKSTVKVTSKSTTFYDQHFLIDFPHWNEEKFFANESGSYELPSFSLNGFKFAIVNGFELHFDTVFAQVMQKNIDVVLTPSASTFESALRWSELLKMRAFLNNVYILRANRVGVYKAGDDEWKFYGHSKLLSPFGEVEETLGDKDEILFAQISKQTLHEAKKVWGWRRKVNKII